MNCLKCNRRLKNEKSLEHQYGPVCWSKVHEKEKEELTLMRWFS
jgi:hypothetical protein